MSSGDLALLHHNAQPDELWRHIFSTRQAGIIISVNSTIQELNRTAMAMIGARSKADVVNRPFLDTFLLPEHIERARQREQILKSRAASLPPMEVRVKRLDGGSIDALISATSWKKNGATVIESILIDITPLKQRERLLEAVSKLMEITVREDLSSNVAAALRHSLSAMHTLYAEPHICGYVRFVRREHDILDAANGIAPLSDTLLISSEPLPEPSRQWLQKRARTIAQRESRRARLAKIPTEAGNQAVALVEPFRYTETIEGCFFWIFPGTERRAMLLGDGERRDTFILAAFNALKNFAMRLDNERKSSDLAILNRAAIEIGKAGKLQEIANTALELLANEKGWAPSVIRVTARGGEALETVAYRDPPGTPPEESSRRMRALNKIINESKSGMTGEVIKTGAAIRSLNLPSDPRYVETDPSIRYGIYAPIIIESRAEGAIGVESATYAFTASDLRLLTSIGEIVGMATISLRLIEVQRERVSLLEALHKINQQIGVEAKPGELYQILVRKAVEVTRAESAALLIYNPSNDKLEERAAAGWLGGVFGTSLGSREGISGAIFTTGTTHLSPSLRDDPLLSTRNLPLIPRGRANIGVPVIVDGKVIGVFHLVLKAPAPFTREFIELVEIFASYAGIVIGRMQRIDALRQTKQQLQTAYDETLEGWARAIGIRDSETLMHAERVARIAMLIGRELGLDGQALENLNRGALLHDVGKIGIPDSILRKPEALSAEERQIMQTHASFGYELLKPIKFLEDAIVVPYCHHERWDGTGYPRQLSGECIPLLARVFAIADVYDAMTSNRSYRSARTPQEAIEYIREQSGKHFDPRMVEAFLRIYSDLD